MGKLLHFVRIGLAMLAAAGVVAGAEGPGTEPAPDRASGSNAFTWAGFVETNFPFFSTALDARKLGDGWPADNLTPRGLVLNLGHECWACFDLDLLRMSAVWSGRAVTPVSMSQGSYHSPRVKAPEGQGKLPRIDGQAWIANGIYPGWQSGAEPTLTDPRERGPDADEVGRGPLERSSGRFNAIRLVGSGALLEYEVAGTSVRERVEARVIGGHRVVQRYFRLDKVSQPLCLLLGFRSPRPPGWLMAALAADDSAGGRPPAELAEGASGLRFVRVFPSVRPVEFRVALAVDGPAQTWKGEPDRPSGQRWPAAVTTVATLAPGREAYVVDNIPLPLDNPWRRNVRLADLAFRPDGEAAAVTFDGDVWRISGLGTDSGRLTWRRFASGLHEPLALAIRDEEIFVYDRNGIWRLVDRDGDGEADVHELFSNAFAQTAETREFVTSMKLAPDGSFIIAKGGQESTTVGKHNGTVLRVSRDGGEVEVLGWGFRMPFVGVHPRTGLVTASDQQGHYIPATPLHIVRDHQYYGFIPLIRPKERYPAPIADPLTWIPHPINASGVCQVWLASARMGPLNEALIHLGYYRPELFLVLLNQRAARAQAAVVSLTRDLAFPPLSGAVHPRDGQLYVTGFQIWGSEARQNSGLARLRYTGAPSPLPRAVIPTDQGILLRFDVPISAASATNPANFSAERWNYRRSAEYGSPHYRLDGSKGQEAMTPSSAYLSKDAKGIFLGVPDMKPVMQMRLGWSLATTQGGALAQNAYFTPHELVRFDSEAEGFAPFQVDLTPRAALPAAATPITAAEGKRVSELMGCVACHSVDGSTLGKVGPSWKGLFGRERQFADGTKATADQAYLRESIKEPLARVVRGFDQSDTGMPSYEGVITDSQIEALIEYIKTLR